MADEHLLLSKGEDAIASKVDGVKDYGTVTFRLALSIFVAVLGSFQYGWHISVLNTPETIIKAHVHATDAMWAAVVATFAVGGFCGTQLAAVMANRLGRSRTLALNSIGFIVTGALQCAAGFIADSNHNVGYIMLLIGRVTAGLSCGLATVVVPMWLSEVASLDVRGMLGSLNQFAVVSGILVTQGIGIAMDSDELYPYLLGMTAGLAGVQLLAGGVVLESPAWLLQNKGAEEAVAMLLAARGYSLSAAETELAEIRSATVAAASVKPPNVVELLFSKAYRVVRWPLVIACVLQTTQQLSGINAVFFYSTSFFESAGVGDPQMGTVLVGGVNVLAMAVAVYLMERAGRRKLLLSGTMGMLLSSLGLVVTLTLKNDQPGGIHVGQFANYLSIAFVLAFVSFFEVGLGAIPWQIGGEIFSETPRATAMGVAAAVNWFGTFLVGLLFPIMNTAIKQYAFLPFTIVLASSFVFQYIYVPETRGQTLPQIQTLLRQDAPPCVAGRTQRHNSNNSSFGDSVPGLLESDRLQLGGRGSANFSEEEPPARENGRFGSQGSADV